MNHSYINWPELIEFSNQILSENTKHKQKQLIIELLESLYKCQAYAFINDQTQIEADLMIEGSEGFSASLRELVKKVINSQKTIYTGESKLQNPASHRNPNDSQKNEINAVAAPITLQEKTVGVCVLEREKGAPFSDDEIKFFEFLAGYIALTLAADSHALGERRWQVADSLREVAGVLSTDISLDQVLRSILEVLLNTLPSTLTAIWLLDDEYNESEISTELRIAAINGLSIESAGGSNDILSSEVLLGYSVDDLIENYSLDESVGSWLYEAMNANDPLIRTFDMSYEPLGALIGLEPNYSAISAPLRIGNTPLGILTMVHEQPGRYGKTSQIISATFASYAAVAIKNTRLYEDAHDQAWVSTVLLQVSEATQSIASLDDLLQTVVHLLPNLTGTQSCAILLWDDYVEAFVPSMAYGFSSLQFEEFENWYIAESDVPAFDKLRTTKAPVFLDKDTTSSSFGETIFSSFDFSTGLYVLFPMITQGEVMGAILVDFRETSDNSTGEISLWEEKISIIQGVANQTAIAADNIKLIQAQEEEAYVSIALLQVAQAVVSSNDLDEILATIVRITPILVGVRRSVIFLWDEDQKLFRASQAYGFSREEISDLQPFYSLNKFQLLDWVLDNNKPIYYSMVSPSEPFEWAEIDVADLTIVDNLDETRHFELLNNKFPLLMGYPLAVKDNVLGVMLVEEVDQASAVPSIRIREKRLEIITGITQQAAIAIQNDILQRDVLERERLEREMQLAREIQSTFLPDHLPIIDGWDLDIRWRPARQVGGDFYDVIELPGNRLGIVIADVADKGMPAALYMTLVRTLIRASIQYQQTPREVLLRVNNLLVPDSRQGMFVTIVYAVLSLDTGELIIANAGHNPPLSFKVSTHRIYEHARDAMALGVFPDIDIQEGKMMLEEGDLILFYTDGITEAFSLQDELFGLERLKEIIQNSNFRSAAQLLERIEASVFDFSEGMSQSDDVTLVVIYRHTTRS